MQEKCQNFDNYTALENYITVYWTRLPEERAEENIKIQAFSSLRIILLN